MAHDYLLTPGKPDEHCHRCLSNGTMAFPVITPTGVDGYIFPGSTPYADEDGTTLLPMPYMWVVATTAHGYIAPDGTAHAWPNDWALHERLLVSHVPTLNRIEGYNIVENNGPDNGERPSAWVTGPHGLRWVITGRNMFREASGASPVCPGTSTLGLATIVHRARQAAGSLPSDKVLARWWREIGEIAKYNRAARSYALEHNR